MRILDSKDPKDKPHIKTAPTYLDHLCAECAAHFQELRGHLDALGIRYTVNPRLVRGLDYYTRTVFEVHSDALGAQSTILGGGRYDGLLEQLGHKPEPKRRGIRHLPPGSRRWHELESATIDERAARSAYREMRMPTFEATELFGHQSSLSVTSVRPPRSTRGRCTPPQALSAAA